MIVKNLKSCRPFPSGDQAVLREMFHPGKETLDLRYSLAHASVLSGKTTLPHRLKTSEVYYILKGSGIMHVDSETESVGSGQAVYIPPGSVQFIENTGITELEFLCIVDPAWRPEDEDVL